MLLSIIIPARHEKYLEATIRDILVKATTNDIEIIAVLDGYWETSEKVVHDARVKYLHQGSPKGMREAIKQGVAIAKGKFILKCDAHVMFARGFDQVLIDNHRNRRVQIPTRKRLDPELWQVIEDGRDDINYLYLTKDYKGVIDNKRNSDKKLAEKKIDRIEAFQGSCWFMRRRFFYLCDLEDSDNWGPMGHEAQETYFKVIDNYGEVVRNKYTWYAHWHKEKSEFKRDTEKSREYMKKFQAIRMSDNIHKGMKRKQLAEMFSGKGAEIGVRDGKFSEAICVHGMNVELLSIDPWSIPYCELRSIKLGQEVQERCYKEACERLARYNCKIIRAESLVAVQDIAYESLDFVYIDGSHQFDYVMCDIIEWGKRVKPGGIISGHDYCRSDNREVVDAVDIYCRIHDLTLNLTDERAASWWVIKR